MLNKLNRTLQLSLLMTFIVIVLGSYTRLKDAGLGCPDWPGCYGKIFAPTTNEIFSSAEATKAWIEMIHRYVAGTLGLLILYIAIQGVRLRAAKPKLWILTSSVLLLVIYQALLGMWTVTMTLNPVIVMGHLLGGFTILSCLWWIYLQVKYKHLQQAPQHKTLLHFLIITCLVALATQIALGGWVSANYSALVCADFPTCQGHWWPTMDWKNAFGWPGTPLENNARVTIQMAHRIGAGITSLLVLVLWDRLLSTQNKILTRLAWVLLFLLSVQVGLGITNVLGGLPIMISLAHSATAVLLLLCLLATLFFTNAKSNHHQ